MSGFFHGVTVTNVDTGARSIALPSSSIIGLVDTFTEGPGVTAKANDLILITSEREAVAAFGQDAAITKACRAIYSRAKAVIVACGVAKLEDAAEQTSAIIGNVLADGKRTGLQALLDGKSRFNAQPRLLVTPKHSATQAVGTALVALADKLRAIAIIDGPNTTDEAAIAYAKNFGAKRAFLVDPGVRYWDNAEEASVDAPGSAWVAGLFAYTDREYGFWASPSNKEFVGITGTTRAVEFLDGDDTCRANLLNNANIATIIRDDGFRPVERPEMVLRHPRADHGHRHGRDPLRPQVGRRPLHHRHLRQGRHRRPAGLHARPEEPGRDHQLRGLRRSGTEHRQPAGAGQGVLEHPLHRCAACRKPQFPRRSHQPVADRSPRFRRLRSASTWQ